MDWGSILKGAWRFMMPVLIAAGLIVVGVAVSFVWWGPFSFRAYSDRLFWGGIGSMLVGGFVVVASLGSYRTLGTPSILTAPGDAPIAAERIREYIKTNSGRYGFIFRALSVGALCMVVASLVDVLSR